MAPGCLIHMNGVVRARRIIGILKITHKHSAHHLQQCDITKILLDHRFHDHLKHCLNIGGVGGCCEMWTNYTAGIVISLQKFVLDEKCGLIDISVGTCK